MKDKDTLKSLFSFFIVSGLPPVVKSIGLQFNVIDS